MTGKVQVITEMMMQDSEFQSKARKVEQQISKLSTANALIKMKLDDRDFRKQLQEAVAEAEKAIRRAYGAKAVETVTYKNAKGNTTKIDTEASMRKAAQFALEQSVNKGLSGTERNAWDRRYQALNKYLELLDTVRTSAKSAARELRAVESGRIQSVRNQSARQNNQEEAARRRILQIEKEIAKERTRHTRGGGQWVNSLQKQISLYHDLEAAAKKAGEAGSEKYARRMITLLNKQSEALEKVNAYFGKQSRVMNGLRNLMYRYVSIYSVARFGEKVAETTGYFQQQQVALEGILQSASKARSVLNEIKDFALHSPFQTRELVTFTKQLGAFGVGDNDIFTTVKKLADISAGLGVDMGRIILAYGQVKSAAVLRGQELRQFTEAGIPMVQALADKFTELNGKLVTTGDVFKLISERKVPFEMVASVLSDMTAEGGRFYNMQENITNTTYGQIQKLKDLWTLAMDDMGKGSKGFINGFIKGLQKIVKNIQPIAIMLATAFVTHGIAKVVTITYQLARAFRSAAVAARLFSGGLLSTIGGAAGIALGAVIGLWVNARQNANALQRKMSEVADGFVKDTQRMVDGLDKLEKKINAENVGTRKYNEAVSTLAANYSDFISSDIIDALKGQGAAAQEAASKFAELAEAVKLAIERQQTYNSLMAQGDVAAGTAGSNASETGKTKSKTDTNFSTRADILSEYGKYTGGQQSVSVYEMFGITEFLKKNPGLTHNVLRDAIADIIGNAVTEAAKDGIKLSNEDAINARLKAAILNAYALDENTVDAIVKQFNRLGGIDAGAYNAAIEKYSGAKSTIDYAIREPFLELQKRIDAGKIGESSTADAIEKEVTNEREAIFALAKSLEKANIGEYKGSNLESKVNDAIALANSENANGKVLAQTSHDILEEIHKFENGKGANIVSLLSTISKQYYDYAPSRSGHAARITNAFRETGNLQSWRNDPELSSVVNTYARPTDATYPKLREQLQSEISRLRQAIDDMTPGQYHSEDRRIMQKQLEALITLRGDAYYGIEEKKTEGGSGREYDIEISEFISRLKDAYEVYKKATQAEGADMGLAYMQNDKKMQERFFNFFHGFDEAGELDIFKNEKGQDIKIGKSGQTIRDLLKDAFIDEGIEKGVIDFEKAIRKVGEAMIEYGKRNEKARRGFISAGKAYIKYADQISKDNVTAWIADVNKQFTDLGKTFERTNQQVELYRTLMKNGTSEQLGQFAGVGRGASMTPDSVRNAGDIQKMMALYNKLLREEASKNLKEGETLDESKLNFLSIDRLSSVSDIQNAIATVTERMKLNKDNFGLGTYGEAGNKLEALLKNQLGIIIRELQSISSEQYTGDNLADAIANAQTRVKTAIDITRSQEKVNQLYGGDHGAAMKGRMDAVFAATQSVFDEFLKSNNFEAMSQATRFFTNKDGTKSNAEIWGAAGIDIEKLKEKFRKIVDNVDDNILKDELEKKFRDLELKVLEFNAAGGDLGAIHDNIQLYKGAHQEAVERYDTYKAKHTVLGNQIETGGYANAEGQFVQFSNEEIQQMKEELAACNEELVKMGENGINFEKSLKAEALKNIQANISKASQGLDAMQNAVMGVVNAAKSMAKAINKVYDVMNDGENPAWMQDMEGFLEDFGDAFQMLIAPIGAVIAMIMALAIVSVTAESMMTPLLIVMLAIIAAALIVAAIVAAFQQHDRALQRDIENLEKQIEDTQNAMKNLEAAAQRMSGFRKMNTEIQALSKNYDIYKDKLKQAELEEDKKNTDNDKVKEYKQGAQEALDEFLNSLKDATDEITGSVQDWASSLSEALRSAFQNGENAARAFRNTAIEMVGDIVNKIIEMTVLEPMIENAIQGLLGYSLDKNSSNYIGAQDRFKNSDGSINSQKLADYVTGQLSNDNAEGIYQFMKSVEGGYGRVIDFINNDLAKPLKEAWAYNSDTSELSGGIQGITEDTARTLEGLANSQLAQLVLIQRSVLAIEGSGFAQIQTSWFNDILNHQKATRIATESIKTAIDEMRNGIRPMSVSMS